MGKTLPYTTLRAVRETASDWGELEAIIEDFFRDEIYYPLLEVLHLPKTSIQNAAFTHLEDALNSGRITFHKGTFSGKLNSRIVKDLRALGARFNKLTGCYTIKRAELPVSVRSAIDTSEGVFVKKLAALDTKIAQILPSKLVDKIKLEKLFDRKIFRIETDVKESMKNLAVAPQMSDTARKNLAAEWQDNTRLYIKYFSEEQIKKLRTEIQAAYFAGNRYENLIKHIQTSYGVSANKAKFLARHETRMLAAKFKETRYRDAGIMEYKWQAVRGSPKHPTRPQHLKLSHLSDKGAIFRFDDPPVTTEPGRPERRNNPGMDYNCVIGETEIKLSSNIRRGFKRRYTGGIVKITDVSGVSVSVTPNHPILTDTGWVFAKHVNESHKLLKCLNPEVLNIFDTEVDHSYPSAEQVFNFLEIRFPSERVAGPDVKFHGDASDHEVDVITVDAELSGDGKAARNQEVKNAGLTHADFAQASFTRSRALVSFFGANTPVSSRFVSFLGLSDPSGGVHASPLDFLSLRLPPNMDTAFLKSVTDDISACAKELRNLILTHKLDSVQVDDFGDVEILSIPRCAAFFSWGGVSRISQEEYSGHVYNFETQDNTYIAQNTTVSNCRCVARPIVRGIK